MNPPNLRYLIGVDGGGTATRARLHAADGRLLGDGAAGPSALGQGVAQAWRHIGEAVDAAFSAAGLVSAPIGDCALGLGLSGAENPGWVADFHAANPGWARVALASDGAAAVLGAHAGGAGALLALGTGSIGVARHADGSHQMVSGWGWQIGDEAGGAWFGQQAVRLAQRAMDGRAPAGALAQAVWQHGGASRAELLDWCAAAGQGGYAALAPLVLDHEAIDPAAAALVAQAVDDARAIVRAMDPDGVLALAITGSLGRQLAARIVAGLPHRQVDPAGDACDGALHLIRQALRGEVR
ncbi:BadF/BadG/BcrA/BcrD ATPase family protein [Leptothrix discophora]|uniref:BadF/BadG/BcrA/BcrD ATPase family protein n=1 Tax=Leptothrix discophora TaxID=89 RepID=A0ABT9G5M1_LEPDI|nr:BadF/BadG/BcrA/BcrD ATPase family protein [Leptothrix discophora]MDP4301792.1 BadF/BadG/BcrA/BcrD ATPase family protein [Leptothrix discophora]